jgi:HEAT repeat protein
MAQAALPAAAAEELAEAVHDDRWFRRATARAGSWVWWRRLEAARLLAELGTARDHGLVQRLLRDHVPAVRVGASAALRRVATPALIEQVLDELADQPLVVRSYQTRLLKQQWVLTREALLLRLRPDAPPTALPYWINVAESLALPELLEATAGLAAHPAAMVRLAVARALRQYFGLRSQFLLEVLLRDPDWRVRAQAARALGVLGDARAVPALAAATGDAVWWVRFRASLALSQLGEPGRAALRAARDAGDQDQAQMAAMVAGLSPGSVLELVEG